MWEKKHLRTKTAQAEYHKAWYKKNRRKRLNQIYERRRVHVQEAQKQLVEYLKTHPCVDCGETDILVLEFDHRNPKTKKSLVSSMVGGGMLWKSIHAEIRKCDVRCANCHKRKTNKQFGYYRTKHE